MKKIKFLILILIIISCKDKKIEYYENGKTKKVYYVYNNKIDGKYTEYEPDGKTKLIHNFKSGKHIDSTIYFKNGIINEVLYYKNSKVFYLKKFRKNQLDSEGFFSNGKKNGIWKFYDKNNKLIRKLEYVNVCGKEYVNQGWEYKDGLFIKEYGNYYITQGLKSSYKKNEIINFKIKYNPLLYLNSLEKIYISDEINNNFCNLNTVRLDSARSVNHSFDFSISYKNTGKKYIRGYIKEFYEKEATKDNPTTYGERIVYVNVPINIK